VPDDIDAALAEPGVVVEELPAEGSQPSPADLPMMESSLKEKLKSLERKRERLTVTSPVDGQVMTPHLAERLLHKGVRRGEVLLTIGEAAEGEELASQTPDILVDRFPGDRGLPAAAPNDAQDHILPVDWQRVVEGTDTTSNWRLMPGDRIFVRRKPGR
jgi:hypothetical protein